MEDVKCQEREEETFRKRELPGRFTVKKLFRWMDKRYNKEYWGRLKRNWKQWKGGQLRERKTIKTIREEKEIEQKNSGIKEWTEDDKMGNMIDPCYEL